MRSVSRRLSAASGCSLWQKIRDAVRFYLAHLRPHWQSEVREAFAILAEVGYVGSLSRYLRGGLSLCKLLWRGNDCRINARQIDEWLRGLASAQSRAIRFVGGCVLFSFAKRRGYITENPVGRGARKERETEVRFFRQRTVRLLECADSERAVLGNRGICRFAWLRLSG